MTLHAMEFDYVIVGAGSAGCVLANRLSASPGVSVCLIEAGPPDSHPLIHMPLGLLWLMHSRRLNWRFNTAPEAELHSRTLFWPRGRMLGGSSSSNAMCYTRGHPDDYDHWAALGNPGWSYADVLPWFRRAEHNARGDDEFHGADGPLRVGELPSPNPLSEAFVDAGVECGLTRNPDFNGTTQEGVGLYQVTQHHGRRWSAARAYLRPVRRRANLTVITGAQASRIRFDGRRAIGVDYLRGGRPGGVRARGEVLVAGGTINSPQLLMLSGIGDTTALQALGIPVLAHRPGVGRNLQDHLDILVVQGGAQPVSWGLTPRMLRGAALRELWRYITQRRGMFSTNAAEAGGFARSHPDLTLPDLQFHFTPARLRNHGRDLRFMMGEGYSLHVCNLRPKSRGEIRLASRDPMARPVIQPNYLSDPDDLPVMLAGLRLARQILAAPAFDAWRGEELLPGSELQSDEALCDYIRANAETIYHPVGSCAMGNDVHAVVDARLRVHGVERLRVVDASIMPTLVGGNTNAPVIMVAEKAAAMILEDARRR